MVPFNSRLRAEDASTNAYDSTCRSTNNLNLSRGSSSAGESAAGEPKGSVHKLRYQRLRAMSWVTALIVSLLFFVVVTVPMIYFRHEFDRIVYVIPVSIFSIIFYMVNVHIFVSSNMHTATDQLREQRVCGNSTVRVIDEALMRELDNRRRTKLGLRLNKGPNDPLLTNIDNDGSGGDGDVLREIAYGDTSSLTAGEQLTQSSNVAAAVARRNDLTNAAGGSAGIENHNSAPDDTLEDENDDELKKNDEPHVSSGQLHVEEDEAPYPESPQTPRRRRLVKKRRKPSGHGAIGVVGTSITNEQNTKDGETVDATAFPISPPRSPRRKVLRRVRSGAAGGSSSPRSSSQAVRPPPSSGSRRTNDEPSRLGTSERGNEHDTNKATAGNHEGDSYNHTMGISHAEPIGDLGAGGAYASVSGEVANEPFGNEGVGASSYENIASRAVAAFSALFGRGASTEPNTETAGDASQQFPEENVRGGRAANKQRARQASNLSSPISPGPRREERDPGANSPRRESTNRAVVKNPNAQTPLRQANYIQNTSASTMTSAETGGRVQRSVSFRREGQGVSGEGQGRDFDINASLVDVAKTPRRSGHPPRESPAPNASALFRVDGDATRESTRGAYQGGDDRFVFRSGGSYSVSTPPPLGKAPSHNTHTTELSNPSDAVKQNIPRALSHDDIVVSSRHPSDYDDDDDLTRNSTTRSNSKSKEGGAPSGTSGGNRPASVPFLAIPAPSSGALIGGQPAYVVVGDPDGGSPPPTKASSLSPALHSFYDTVNVVTSSKSSPPPNPPPSHGSPVIVTNDDHFRDSSISIASKEVKKQTTSSSNSWRRKDVMRPSGINVRGNEIVPLAVASDAHLEDAADPYLTPADSRAGSMVAASVPIEVSSSLQDAQNTQYEAIPQPAHQRSILKATSSLAAERRNNDTNLSAGVGGGGGPLLPSSEGNVELKRETTEMITLMNTHHNITANQMGGTAAIYNHDDEHDEYLTSRFMISREMTELMFGLRMVWCENRTLKRYLMAMELKTATLALEREAKAAQEAVSFQQREEGCLESPRERGTIVASLREDSGGNGDRLRSIIGHSSVLQPYHLEIEGAGLAETIDDHEDVDSLPNQNTLGSRSQNNVALSSRQPTSTYNDTDTIRSGGALQSCRSSFPEDDDTDAEATA